MQWVEVGGFQILVWSCSWNFSGFIVGPSGINGSKVPIPSEPLFSTEPTHSVPTFQTSTTRMYRLKLIKVRLNVLINPAQIEEMN